jgi:gamma-glutamylcyclotransferase (GGCT)/AIG2-like uncharacterized protein YtfP
MGGMMKDKGFSRVLVYGTLKQEGTNHPLLQRVRADFLGYDSITAPHVMYDLGPFPCIADSKIRNTIRGEVYGMDEEGLAALDLLEGHPNFYQRTRLWTDKESKVWVYYLNSEDLHRAAPMVEDGLWQPSEDEQAYWDRHL